MDLSVNLEVGCESCENLGVIFAHLEEALEDEVLEFLVVSEEDEWRDFLDEADDVLTRDFSSLRV